MCYRGLKLQVVIATLLLWITEVKGPFHRVYGRDPFNQNSDRSDREKWFTSKGGPVFSKLFWLDRTDPLSFGPKFPENLVERMAPYIIYPDSIHGGRINYRWTAELEVSGVLGWDGDGGKNVAWKENTRSFKLHRGYSISKFRERERTFRRRLFTSALHKTWN